MSAPAVKRTRYAHGIPLPRVANGRTQDAKRFRTLVTQFARELGDNLSAADQSIVLQAAHLTLASERLRARSVNGEPDDVDALVRVNSEARRVIGLLQAKAVKVRPSTGPSIDDLFAVDEASAE
ncbi:hypothetical protein [Bradyrhizobium genosp. P]|uniref:hypothetical protein n=1 Tax=Bradyrhizobium genosp. P TaxID=83641 RepID=UPI003CF901E0